MIVQKTVVVTSLALTVLRVLLASVKRMVISGQSHWLSTVGVWVRLRGVMHFVAQGVSVAVALEVWTPLPKLLSLEELVMLRCRRSVQSFLAAVLDAPKELRFPIALDSPNRGTDRNFSPGRWEIRAAPLVWVVAFR